MRQRDNGRQCGEIDMHFPLIHGIRIRRIDCVGVIGSCFQVFDGFFVHREDSVFGAGFDCHVGNGEAVGHRQVGHARSGKLERLVTGAIDADPANQGQNDIFAADPFGQRTGQDDFNAGRDLEPGIAGCHCRTEIGTADAGGKSANRAISTGVRVSADDHLAGTDPAHLRQQHMLNPHATDFDIMADFVLAGKFAHGFGLLG